MGLSLLIEWGYDARYKLPRTEYVVVLLILVVVGTVGYLEGVAVGVMAAIILFVINYSRIDVIKYALTGENYRSHVDRPKVHREMLREKGEKTFILKSHGFIFFGTANYLLNRVRTRANDPELIELSYVVLGMDKRSLSVYFSSYSITFPQKGWIKRV